MKYNHLFDFEYSLGVFNFRQNLNDFWSIGGIKSDFYLIKLCIQFLATSPVLEQRPKFYSRSRRFRTYSYGYGGQSLRPFLQPKVFLVVFLGSSKMGAEMCFSLHRCHLRSMWIMIVLSLKIKTGPFLMRFL